ncbi:MAG: MFS transporter [Hyphomicrobiales bacterium]|nr:MFS transporter [Hyphomicrobiales bacterium]
MFTRLGPSDAIGEEGVEAGLRAMLRDGLCSQAMGTLTSGVFLVGFALALGANNAVIGLLAAMPFLVNLVQIPTLLWVEHARTRKAIVVAINLFGRTVLLATALAPLLPTPEVRLGALIGGVLIHVVCNGIAGTAWNSWMRDLVPNDRFGTYFGNRLFYATALAAILGFAGAFVVDAGPEVVAGGALQVYSMLFALGAVAGLFGLYYLSITPEPRMAVPEDRRRLAELLARPFRDLNFRRLILFLGSWNFAVNLAAPFFTVYMLTRLGFGMFFVVGMTVVSQAANLVVIRTFGRLADRFSNKSVLAVCGPAFILAIFAWTFTTLPERHAGTVPLLIAIHLLMGFATAGVTLASSNISLELAPRGDATAYLASVSVVNSLAAGIAPIIGGLFADFFAAQELSVVVRWSSPEAEVALDAFSLRYWDFFFLLATVLGLYSIHRLTLVREEGEVKERVVLNELMLEARRTIRNLSPVAGLRGLAVFPFVILRRRRSRRRRHAPS